MHLFSAIAAFGPLFLYPRLHRAGETSRSPGCTCDFVFPALVVLWVAGMGMAGVGKISLAGTPFITATIVLWLVRARRELVPDPPGPQRARRELRSRSCAMGVGITHLILVVSMYLMIFKPGGYSFNT